MITDCITLRIRKGPGTNYQTVGSLAAGTTVRIYETTGGGAQLWGRIDQGWISMNYVELDVEVTDPEEGTVGVVYNCDKLNVRSAPGTANKRVARLDPGTQVEIFETRTVKGEEWGRISLGWVCMRYIKLTDDTKPEAPETERPEDKPTEPEKPAEPEKPTEPEKPAEPEAPTVPDEPDIGGNGGTAQTGVIYNTSEVSIRAGAGTKYDKVGSLKKGTHVVIQETAKVGSALWGRIEQGWVHMHYVKLDGREVPTGTVLKTVSNSFVNIRSGAGTGYTLVGKYSRGDTVLIYERADVDGTEWGRTDKGWICMDYVK